MSKTELEMQPTIHLQSKPGYCILHSVGLIITREIPCISEGDFNSYILSKKMILQTNGNKKSHPA
jgi:hypothetical protein